MATGTQLATVERDSYLALQEGSEIREAMQANMAGGASLTEQDLIRVKTPSGGATKWTIESITGDEVVPAIEGILVYFCMRGVLWPSEDPGDHRPVLVTDDLIHARRVGDELGDIDPKTLDKFKRSDGSYDWQSLPYNQFGSAANGVGKRCKESRVLFVLPQDKAFPYVVQAQPGSLKTVKPLFTQLTNVGLPYYRAVISLTLQKVKNSGGQEFSQIVPRVIGSISPETGAMIKREYTEPLSKVAQQMEFTHEDDLD